MSKYIIEKLENIEEKIKSFIILLSVLVQIQG